MPFHLPGPVLVGSVFVAVTWLLALGWVGQAIWWFVRLPSVADLTQRPMSPTLPVGRQFTPDLTVIVPACDEEAAIASTLRSLLHSNGIRLQIIAVNDRSRDRTGNIMDEVATYSIESGKAAHTMEVLHVEVLPPGWLGKPHALALGARRAQADWLLFTDGDVSFAPDALALALDYVKAEPADHLVVMPDWITGSLAESAVHGALHALSTWSMRPWRVADPKARDFLGVGAFNLVRRSTYEALGGFNALRMEVLEDLRLGWMIKRAGYRSRVAYGPGLVSIRWSDGPSGVVRNLEKNLFALYRYNLFLALGACGGLLIQIAWPLTALLVGGWARTAALVLYAAVLGIYLTSRRLTRVHPLCFLLYPLAAGLFLFAHLRSIVLALVRGGVVWRGTLYRLKDLRAHAGRFW